MPFVRYFRNLRNLNKEIQKEGKKMEESKTISHKKQYFCKG